MSGCKVPLYLLSSFQISDFTHCIIGFYSGIEGKLEVVANCDEFRSHLFESIILVENTIDFDQCQNTKYLPVQTHVILLATL